MNPAVVIALISAAWLAGMFVAWAFVHGAQILRREESAAMYAAGGSGTASVPSIAPEADRLPAAA